MRVQQACALAGIYRVGLRVRSETTGQVMGFPLFLPPAPSGTPSGRKGGKLDVKVVTVAWKESAAPSDVSHVYAAVRRAVERRAEFGVDAIVGSLWIATNAPLQYALSAIDMMYRGGCVGVRLRRGVLLPRLETRGVPKIEIQGGVVSRHPQPLKPRPLQPRSAPWPLNGAAQPGWVDLQLADLPSIAGEGKPPAAGPQPRPNYAALAGGVPPNVRAQVEGEIRTWAQSLGRAMLSGLRGGSDLEKLLVVGLRRKEAVPELIEPARRTFPDATRVVPSALQFSTYLFHRGTLRGRADATLHLTSARPSLVFGSWVPLGDAPPLNLVPFPVDPFAAGRPSSFRIWLEAIFDAARRGGVGGLPLAPAAEVLANLPAVAHRGTQAALSRRGERVRTLAAQLARTPYDRVVLVPLRGTATVVAGRRVVGILSFSVRSEENELRLDDLRPRRAR
jgi:hypothetical protein